MKIIANESSGPESMTDISMKLPSSAISEHSSVKGTPKAIREWLMSSRQAFPVSRSQQQEKDKGKMTSAICGPKQLRLFAQYDHGSHSWRTSQVCWVSNTYGGFSETWPKAGLMQDGMCWELQQWAEIVPANEFGLWPAPKKSDGEQVTSNYEYYKRRLNVVPDLPVITALSTPPTVDGIYGRLNPDWVESLINFPTGWTGLRPLGMHKILDWQQQHGGF